MKVRIAARTIPGGDATRVAVLTQATDPGIVPVALSVQEEAIGAGGIVRDDGAPYMIVAGPDGPIRIDDQLRFRDWFLPVIDARDSHVIRFERRHPDRIPIAITGCGNLLCNRGVEARTDRGRIGIPGFAQSGIVVDEDGRGRMLRDAELARELASGSRGYAAGRFLITGPMLVTDGRAAEPDARAYADLRHLLLPPYVATAGAGRIDFGFDALTRDVARARDAVAGRAVTLESGIDPDALRAALAEKGYWESAAPSEPGTYRIGRDAVTMVFLPGIYPHHALAVASDGRVVSVIVTGRSNREGTTIRDLAGALAEAGARDAILLDNGGDVGMLRRREPRADAPLEWVARPAEEDRVRAWPQRACLIYHATRRG